MGSDFCTSCGNAVIIYILTTKIVQNLGPITMDIYAMENSHLVWILRSFY